MSLEAACVASTEAQSVANVRSESGRRAAQTRRRNKAIASAGAYGALLGALWTAQQASDRAKGRAADGVHWADWAQRDYGRYAHHRYEVSRAARARDYAEKERDLAAAVTLLPGVGLTWGWQATPVEPRVVEDTCWGCGGYGVSDWGGTCDRCDGTGLYRRYVSTTGPTAVLYVDLPTGQVSFHAMARGLGPDYPGVWDGVVGASRERIEAAIDAL